MILLITASKNAPDCAAAIEQFAKSPTTVESDFRRATGFLREREYKAVVVDENLLDTNPDYSDTFVDHVGSATPVFVNFAISSVSRVASEVKAALLRRKRDESIAREHARAELLSELNSELTGLLVSSQAALRAPGVSDHAKERLQMVYEIAERLRGRLDEEAVPQPKKSD